MNKSYNIVWNAARNMYVVASELARGDNRIQGQVRAVGIVLGLAMVGTGITSMNVLADEVGPQSGASVALQDGDTITLTTGGTGVDSSVTGGDGVQIDGKVVIDVSGRAESRGITLDNGVDNGLGSGTEISVTTEGINSSATGLFIGSDNVETPTSVKADGLKLNVAGEEVLYGIQSLGKGSSIDLGKNSAINVESSVGARYYGAYGVYLDSDTKSFKMDNGAIRVVVEENYSYGIYSKGGASVDFGKNTQIEIKNQGDGIAIGENGTLQASGLTINTDIKRGTSAGIRLYDSSSADLGEGSAISITGAASYGVAVDLNGKNSSFKANGLNVDISTTSAGAPSAHGIYLHGNGASADLGSGSTITIRGANQGYGIILFRGAGSFKADRLTLDVSNNDSTHLYGINVQGDSNIVDLGSGSRISADGRAETIFMYGGKLTAQELTVKTAQATALYVSGGRVSIGAGSVIDGRDAVSGKSTNGILAGYSPSIGGSSMGSIVDFHGSEQNRNAIYAVKGYGASAYSAGYTLNISNTDIVATGQGSCGLLATGPSTASSTSGIINAKNMNIEVNGGAYGLSAQWGGLVNFNGNTTISAKDSAYAIYSMGGTIKGSGVMNIRGDVFASGAYETELVMDEGSNFNGGAFTSDSILNLTLKEKAQWTIDYAGSLQSSAVSKLDNAGTVIFTSDSSGRSTLKATELMLRDTSEVHVGVDAAVSGPLITGNGVTLDGSLVITDVGNVTANIDLASMQQVTLIDADTSIVGNFDRLSAAVSMPDYIAVKGWIDADDDTKYLLSTGLSWYVGDAPSVLSTTPAHGTFTLADADDGFTVTSALVDVAPEAATDWGGKTLTKRGEGALTLTGNNTYSGGTVINGGTLIANNTYSLGSGDIENNATLKLGEGTLNAHLSGAGLLVKIGSSSLTLADAANSYSGGTTITAGRVIANNAGALGIGDIDNEGTLQLSEGTLAGALNGSGNLVKSGGGELTLSDSSGYSGGTTISGGTLTANSASALGVGNVENNGTLKLNEGELSSTLSGTGELVKVGGGELTLSGNNAYGGGTTINGGTLTAANVNALGAGDIDNGGRLVLNVNDTFTLANVTTRSGGATALSAGSSLDAASLMQESGSRLDIALDAYSGSPIIAADSVQLAGGLNITGFGNIEDELDHEFRTFTVIDADSAIGGDFDSLTVAGISALQVDFMAVSGRISATDNTQYELSTGLSWYAGGYTSMSPAHGTFTLKEGEQSFALNAALIDVAPEAASGWDGKSLTKKGAGTLILTANNAYSGATDVQGGTLWLADTGAIGASGSRQAVNVAQAGTLGGSGVVNGSVNNRGLLSFDSLLTVNGRVTNSGNIASGNGTPGGRLLVNGDYVGSGGTLTLNAQLEDDASLTDRLVVNGNTSGTTTLMVNNVGGQGADTTNGIEVVSVSGSSNGVFTQGNRLQIGLHEYRLYKDDGNWYLRTQSSDPVDPVDPSDSGNAVTPQYRPDIGAVIGNQAMMKSLQMQTLFDREGSQLQSKDGAVWMRFKAGMADSTAANGNVDIDNHYSQIQLGGDLAAWRLGEQILNVGVMGSYVKADTDSTGNRGADGSRFSATGDAHGYNLGVYATWFANAQSHQGLYVDSWYQYGMYDNTISNDGLGSANYDSTANAVSLEAGYRHDVVIREGRTLSLIPQAQVVWQNYKADTVNVDGTRVGGQNGDSWTSRLGLRVAGKMDKDQNVIQPFLEANWLHSTDDVSVSFDGASVKQDLPADRAELKAGIQANFGSQWSVAAQAAGQKGSHGYGDASFGVNVRYSW
ncbi:autotransporter outer membrane beta-barrel domain-containing protein [Leminorella grimontii]|uniref:autotransporter outer membrane beta-barrel domain-containing protein n=1 Tax=Leminorella grimontii TaxID=82981 RepID=UPI0032204B87